MLRVAWIRTQMTSLLPHELLLLPQWVPSQTGSILMAARWLQQLQPLHLFMSKPSGENMGSLSRSFWKFSLALVQSCAHPWKGPLWPGGHSGQTDQAWARNPPSATDWWPGSDPRGRSRYGFSRTGMDVGWEKTQKPTQLTSWWSSIHKYPSLHAHFWGRSVVGRITAPKDAHLNLWKLKLSLT